MTDHGAGQSGSDEESGSGGAPEDGGTHMAGGDHMSAGGHMSGGSHMSGGAHMSGSGPLNDQGESEADGTAPAREGLEPAERAAEHPTRPATRRRTGTAQGQPPVQSGATGGTVLQRMWPMVLVAIVTVGILVSYTLFG